MFRRLNPESRALANSMLRAPEVIEDICLESEDEEGARQELVALVWLFASLIHELERTFACDYILRPNSDHDDPRVPIAIDYSSAAGADAECSGV